MSEYINPTSPHTSGKSDVNIHLHGNNILNGGGQRRLVLFCVHTAQKILQCGGGGGGGGDGDGVGGHSNCSAVVAAQDSLLLSSVCGLIVANAFQSCACFAATNCGHHSLLVVGGMCECVDVCGCVCGGEWSCCYESSQHTTKYSYRKSGTKSCHFWERCESTTAKKKILHMERKEGEEMSDTHTHTHTHTHPHTSTNTYNTTQNPHTC